MRSPAVILDVDGTLVDSNDAHARAWMDAFSEAGVQVDADRVRRAIGMGGDKLMPHVSGLSEESPEGARISKRRGEIFKSRYLPHVRPFPRVRELVQRFADDGFTIVVASSARKDELGPLLEIAGISGFLHSRTSSDDAEESKPAPDIVQAALERSGAPASHAIMLGDTPYDVEASRRAGVRIVCVECGGWRRAELAGAAAVYADPAHLLSAYGSSVFASLEPAPGAGMAIFDHAPRWWVAGSLIVAGSALAAGLALYQRRRRYARTGAEDVDGQVEEVGEGIHVRPASLDSVFRKYAR